MAVGVKFGNMPADKLVICITEKIQLGLVRPQDRTVRTHPMKADGGGFDEVAEQGLAAPQGLEFVPQYVGIRPFRRLRWTVRSRTGSRHRFCIDRPCPAHCPTNPFLLGSPYRSSGTVRMKRLAGSRRLAPASQSEVRDLRKATQPLTALNLADLDDAVG